MSSHLIRVVMLTLFASTHSSAQSKHVSENRVQAAEGWRHHIQNTGSNSIEAFIATFSCSSEPQMVKYYDPLVEYGSYKALDPGEEFDIQLNDKLSVCDGGIKAVIHSDHSVEGDESAVQAIYDRRKGAYTELIWIEDRIDHYVTTTDTASLLSDLRIREKAQNSALASKPHEWNGSSAVLGFIIFLMEHHALPNVPVQVRSNVPSIKQLQSSQGLSADEAYLVAFNLRLRQWSRDLKAGGFSPASQ